MRFHYNKFADESICITNGGIAAIFVSIALACTCVLCGVWIFRIRFGLADKSSLYI
jgi:ABC-type multidrug transport system permease subunit